VIQQIFTDFAVQSHRILTLNEMAARRRAGARVKAAGMVNLLLE
jgi:hypothetical protein